MMTKFEQRHKISPAQYKKLMDIEHAVYDNNEEYLSLLPADVADIARKADAALTDDTHDMESVYTLDAQLAELVKLYWDEDGIAISQPVVVK